MHFNLTQVLCVSVVVAVAGLLRGFSGFGFAMVAVPLATMFMEPVQIVPVVLALQLSSGVLTLRTDWHEIDRRSVGRIALVAVPFLIIGTWALTQLPGKPIRMAIGCVTIGAALLLWRSGGRKESGPPTVLSTMLAGSVSGLLHGMVAMGGPPLTMFYLSGRFSPPVARASITAIFTLISILPLGASIYSGHFTWSSLWLFAILAPTMLFATAIGSGLFRRFPNQHRSVSLPLLGLVGLIALVNASALP